jgi:hypothetical protein
LLREQGLEVDVIQVNPAQARLRVSDADESVVLDLVAEPSPALEPPEERPIGDSTVRVDGRHEILVDKLCALLGRAEVRDLVDVQGLLAVGTDLIRALGDAPTRDTGFSAMTLAWVLRGMPLSEVAATSGLSEKDRDELTRFRDDLVDRLTRATDPGA